MNTAVPMPTAPDRAPGRSSALPAIGLVVALAATGALVISGGSVERLSDTRGGRMSAAAAWPAARLSTIPDLALQPLLFLDTATVVGTAPGQDGELLRLLLRSATGVPRELRRLATADNPRFENVTVAGDHVVWTEFSDGRPPEIWAVHLRAGTPARRLTADIGIVAFYGGQYDLVHHDGRVYWTAQPEDGTAATEVRSVALSGGPVDVVSEEGEWTMTAWPWLGAGARQGSGATRLRDVSTGREVTVPTTDAELATCSPSWCRVMVLDGAGLGRIDLMRPDGSARRQIADGTARTAVADVAILDRFEILAEPGPHSGTTGTAGLLVYDLRTGRTVQLASAANGAQSRGGLLWWYSSSAQVTHWHVLDLRTA